MRTSSWNVSTQMPGVSGTRAVVGNDRGCPDLVLINEIFILWLFLFSAPTTWGSVLVPLRASPQCSVSDQDLNFWCSARNSLIPTSPWHGGGGPGGRQQFLPGKASLDENREFIGTALNIQKAQGRAGQVRFWETLKRGVACWWLFGVRLSKAPSQR